MRVIPTHIKTTTVQAKEAIQTYSAAIELQRKLQQKAIATPDEQLSFTEVTEYLKAVAKEREAVQNISRLFPS